MAAFEGLKPASFAERSFARPFFDAMMVQRFRDQAQVKN